MEHSACREEVEAAHSPLLLEHPEALSVASPFTKGLSVALGAD